MNERQKAIAKLCDGKLTSKEIAAQTGDNAKYVQRTMLKFDLPRLPQAPRCGEHNPSYKCGRIIDRDGYVLVSAPLGHPYARMRKGRKYGRMYEHRLVMENKIGRLLSPEEVVDHIDGLRLHNHPENLRLFGCNSEHLKQTITGQVPNWSEAGRYKLLNRHVANLPPVQTYALMKKNGDARLREILRCALILGVNSKYLSYTLPRLVKAGIVDFSRSSLERELDYLCRKYA